MDASIRPSSERAQVGSLALTAAAFVALAAGCTEQKPGVEGTTSIAVNVTSPTDLGSEAERLPDGNRMVTLDVTVLDAQGEQDPTVSRPLDVYVHFLSSLTPDHSVGEPAFTIPVTGGTGTATVTLPSSFGPTYLWVEDAKGEAATYAAGTSKTLWFREPYLADISRPVDETSLDALERSPLEAKQVNVATSQFGANGRLVVTGVYSQGFTVSDVNCPGGNPPCTGADYAHIYVFSFGRARSTDGDVITVGQQTSFVAGGVGEFNGYTELNFPRAGLVSTDVNETFLPPPVVLQKEWLLTPTGATGMINLEKVESGLVALEGGTVCPLDDDYDVYSQWKVDVGNGCQDGYNVITAGAVNDFDPAAYVGKAIPRIVGTLRAVNIGTFSVWIVYPRASADLVLN